MPLIDNSSMKLKLLHGIMTILESYRKKKRLKHRNKILELFFIVSKRYFEPYKVKAKP